MLTAAKTFCCSIFFLHCQLAEMQGQCVDTVLSQRLKEAFEKRPQQFWMLTPELPAGEKTVFYQEEIGYLSRRLRLPIQPQRDSMHIRIWKWSEWHSGGSVQQLRWAGKNWQAVSFLFDEQVQHFYCRRNPIKTEPDSLKVRLARYNLVFIPPQPKPECPVRQTNYTYMIEIWQQGRYRFFYYQDPEKYAEQGSWADAYLLRVLNELWE